MYKPEVIANQIKMSFSKIKDLKSTMFPNKMAAKIRIS